MREGAVASGYPEPEFNVGNFFDAVFYPLKAVDPSSTPQAPPKYPSSTPQVIALLQAALNEDKKREELQEVAQIKDRKHFRVNYIEPLVSSGLLRMTIPDKPKSPHQRYSTTPKGKAHIEKQEEENK